MLIAIKLSRGLYQTGLTITRGESVALAMTILQADGDTPLDLSGYGMKAEIDLACGRSPLVLDTDDGGIVLTDPEAGEAQLLIDAAATAAIPPGDYPYDLWLVAPNGFELPLLQGLFTVVQNVTPVPVAL
jgi:hypothetical protein